ncbi:hypothetical protein [Belnapia rosea]|uniref:Peptidase propeptide and YPEB domain-containing protein n=1 Tax=Belnapia rosea TaxID=938405 RepID=A0A1G6P9F0_9PROT|nr:hypothetical protein [Belnapia rosea]SDC76628.1 hypothetical protein SAMN04487779_1002308 [Belnapia rosea]
MRTTMIRLALLGAVAAMPAYAQTSPAPTAPAPGSTNRAAPAPTAPTATPAMPDRTGANAPSARSESTPPAVTTDNGTRTATTPAAGANSFTEGQARSRIEAAGFTGLNDLQKDDQGIWRGRAMRNGQQVSVSLDYQGNVTTR